MMDPNIIALRLEVLKWVEGNFTVADEDEMIAIAEKVWRWAAEGVVPASEEPKPPEPTFGQH